MQVQGLFRSPFPRESLARQASATEPIDVTDSFEPGAIARPYLLEERQGAERPPDNSPGGAALAKERLSVDQAPGPSASAWVRAYLMVGVVPRTGDLVDLFS